ncbi:MAG TPA: YebC/PmpR family DNA-binding transcriptional regulator [Fibrobacteria bacterium]|jgi:YebC/PmpR family DNA-binding regulatory protein|nr:YebC/PmpR family DNA-binding transcriptional regulator [Fibrobacteria bacterium]
MSGHSKWATTKRKKARIDQARAKVFNRIIRELTVAARAGGSDPDGNPRLRAAILKAKAANMPQKNIDTNIAKGAGELEGVTYTEITYEGYGPGGTAILVDTMTDNRVRTVAEVRHAFSKNGGNMGEEGSVGWMFKQRGVITLPKDKIAEDALFELATENGAEDFDASGDEYEIRVEPEHYHKLVDALQKKGLEPSSAEMSKLAENMIKVTGEEASRAMELLEALDDLDDVQNVHTNAEFDPNEIEDL